MHVNRGKKYLLKEKYTLFGQWYYFICALLEVNDREVAARAGLHMSTLNVNTRVGESMPKRETVEAILNALHLIADEKSVVWGSLWDEQCYHAAGYATPQEVEVSEAVLDYFTKQED